MKSRRKHNYTLIILFLTILFTLLSAASFTLTEASAPKKSTIPTDRTITNTHSELWPWNTLNERTSAPVLKIFKDTSIINKDILNNFAKHLLLSFTHDKTPHSVIDVTDFSDKIMITEDDFHIWMKDQIIKASNNEEYIIGLYGFIGEYSVAHCVYCIRKSALSEDGVWSDFTKEDMIAYLEESGDTVIYSDALGTYIDTESDDQYVASDGEIYTMGYSLLNTSVDYIYSIMINSGFESIIDEFLPQFDDAICNLNIKAYKNGDLLVISFYDTIPFKLNIFYDLETETFCGWIRE